jgi:hypothetical protein
MSGSISRSSDFDGIDRLTKTSLSQINSQQGQIDKLIETLNVPRRTVLEALFPDKRQQAVIAGQLQAIKDEFEFRRQALLAARTTQLQSLEESCNQYLIRVKAQVRGETFSELMSAFNRLQRESQSAFTEFINTQSQAMQEAKSIPDEALKNILLESIDEDICRFKQLRTTLLNKFDNIIREEVKIRDLGNS